MKSNSKTKAKLTIIKNPKLIQRDRDTKSLSDFLSWPTDSILHEELVNIVKILVKRTLKRKN